MESSSSAQSPIHGVTPVSAGTNGYQLSDDLARLCLPQEFQDSFRTLAWVNSICLLFLLIGLVGLRPPSVIERPLTDLTDIVPVIFTPPEEPPKLEPEIKPDDPQEPRDTPEETPQVVRVLAAADSASVAFAVPVQGAVAVASAAHLATPPPPVVHAPPAPVRFSPDVGDGGAYPPPTYPTTALRNHYEGTVTIDILVDALGKITSAKVQKSSGYPVLDEAALDVVKRTWRFPAGAARWFYWPCTFKME
jgi:TonB family protein